MILDLLHHLQSHPFPLLDFLRLRCEDDSEVRALTTFLRQCSNLRMLQCQRGEHYSVSDSVEEEMWEAAVRSCGNLEEVRVGEWNSDVSCTRLASVLRKLSERKGILALKLRKIVKVDLGKRQAEDWTKQFKHLLPALQQ